MQLNEYKRNFFRLLNEGAAEQYRDAYYPEVDDYMLRNIIEIDPESNGDNLSEFGKFILKLRPSSEDLRQIGKDIDIVAKSQANGKEIDLSSINTVEDLHYYAVDLMNNNSHMSGEEIAKHEQSLDCPVVYSDGEFNVIEICDEESAVYYGKGTMWIWAANNGQMFNQYSQKGKIYVVFEKSAGKKYSVINLGKRLRITDTNDEMVDKSIFPQQLLAAIQGVRESKVVKMNQEELTNFIVEAVTKKLNKIVLSEGIDESIIGSPQYFHNILTGSNNSSPKNDKMHSHNFKRFDRAIPCNYKEKLGEVVNDYNIKILSSRTEKINDNVIEHYECTFTMDTSDLSDNFKETLKNYIAENIGVHKNNIFIRFVNERLLKISIKRKN